MLLGEHEEAKPHNKRADLTRGLYFEPLFFSLFSSMLQAISRILTLYPILETSRCISLTPERPEQWSFFSLSANRTPLAVNKCKRLALTRRAQTFLHLKTAVQMVSADSKRLRKERKYNGCFNLFLALRRKVNAIIKARIV